MRVEAFEDCEGVMGVERARGKVGLDSVVTGRPKSRPRAAGHPCVVDTGVLQSLCAKSVPKLKNHKTPRLSGRRGPSGARKDGLAAKLAPASAQEAASPYSHTLPDRPHRPERLQSPGLPNHRAPQRRRDLPNRPGQTNRQDHRHEDHLRWDSQSTLAVSSSLGSLLRYWAASSGLFQDS